MRMLKAFGQFWYDFIIGDDWKIAVSVCSALTVFVLAMRTGLLGDHSLALLGGATIIVFFACGLGIDARRGSRQKRPER
ncbi:MAG: hypothetical protein ACJ74U_15030 [Jatrophihabitantaceae bacterium]